MSIANVRRCLLASWLALAGSTAFAQDVLVPIENVVDVSNGFGHTCALDTSGVVWCWGNNMEGQLGLGDYWSTATPRPVRGLPGAAVAISSGKTHSCAVAAGGVWCWGANFSGELGTAVGEAGSPSPVAVAGLPGAATDVTVGDRSSCAIVSGAAWCWGDNTFGSLGDGTGQNSATPVAVEGLGSGVTQIAAGVLHTCAIANGGAKCWGNNFSGQVGDGVSGQVVLAASQVAGLTTGVIAIAAGATHTCAIVAAGAVKCWGENGNGQLGTDAVGQSGVPVAATGLTVPARDLATGALHTCVTGTDDTPRCWGGNSYSQLGIGEGHDSNVAVVPIGLTAAVRSVDTRGFHSCALRNDGRVACWGFNAYGQAGEGSAMLRTAPVAVPIANVGALAAGAAHTCAVASGGVQCWGYNGEGAIGTGEATLYVSTPFAIPGLAAGATAVTAGFDHTCAVVDGGVWCWGNNEYGQLGDGSNNNADAPVAVKGLASGVTQISAGGNQTCAVQNGDVLCWGYGGAGVLANGTTNDTNSPLPTVGLDGVVTSLSIAQNHGCAIVADAAKCWGIADAGQLGNGSSSGFSPTPVAVQGLGAGSGVTAISSGYNHTCAVANGAATCWGYDGYGQLGNGILNDTQLTPAPVSGLDAGVVAIAAGDDTTCAVQHGSVLCWGGDYDGDVGNGGPPRSQRLVPTHVIGLAARAAGRVVISGTHACATTTGDGLACWGDDFLGALGIGRELIVGAPDAVVLDDRIFAGGFD
jgi:alpha-tubulin suppressor-like RCC1 family protein